VDLVGDGALLEYVEGRVIHCLNFRLGVKALAYLGSGFGVDLRLGDALESLDVGSQGRLNVDGNPL